MNCRQSSIDLISDHQLISTGYSPDSAGEQRVNKIKTPMKSVAFVICWRTLFTQKNSSAVDGEQVLVFILTVRKRLPVNFSNLFSAALFWCHRVGEWLITIDVSALFLAGNL